MITFYSFIIIYFIILYLVFIKISSTSEIKTSQNIFSHFLAILEISKNLKFSPKIQFFNFFIEFGEMIQANNKNDLDHFWKELNLKNHHQ